MPDRDFLLLFVVSAPEANGKMGITCTRWVFKARECVLYDTSKKQRPLYQLRRLQGAL